MLTNEELLDIYRLKNIIRYNNKLTLTKESVAEHSFYVTLISLMLCDKLQLDNKTTYFCVIKSLLHDMPEIELNDITHDVKEKLRLRSFLEEYEKQYIKDKFPNQYSIVFESNDLVNSLVNLADILSVKQYALTELAIGNKTDTFNKILTDTAVREILEVTKLQRLLEEKNEIK